MVTVRVSGTYSGPRPARHRERAGGQAHGLPVAAIDLVLEEEIRREPLRSRGVHAADVVADQERGQRPAGRARRAPVMSRRVTVRRRRARPFGSGTRCPACPDRAIAPICASRRPAVPAVEQHDPILEIEARELRLHRLLSERVQREPAVGDVRGEHRLGRHGEAGARPVDRARLRTLRDRARR